MLCGIRQFTRRVRPHWLCLPVIALSTNGFPLAQEFWAAKPWHQWTRAEAMEVLAQSPWTRLLRSFPRGSVSPSATDLSARVTLYSARPVRLALYRAVQTDQSYEGLDEASRAEFDREYGALLGPSPDNEIVVALIQTVRRGPNQFTFKGLTAEQFAGWQRIPKEHLLQRVHLVTSSLDTVHPTSFKLPPSPSHFGPMFVFPKTINGTPVVSPSDHEFRFVIDLASAVAGSVSWNPQELVFQGEVSF